MEDSASKPGRGSGPVDQDAANGSQTVRFDWPPPVQAAAFVSGALAFGLLATGHCESGLTVFGLSLALQAWGLTQLRATYKAMSRALNRQ